jgi:hypothetical protein
MSHDRRLRHANPKTRDEWAPVSGQFRRTSSCRLRVKVLTSLTASLNSGSLSNSQASFIHDLANSNSTACSRRSVARFAISIQVAAWSRQFVVSIGLSHYQTCSGAGYAVVSVPVGKQGGGMGVAGARSRLRRHRLPFIITSRVPSSVACTTHLFRRL